jgi:hypothetical protein
MAKDLDLFTVKSFIANGHKYHVSKKISITRWKEYEKLEPRLTYGIGFDDLFKNIKKAYEALNSKEGKIADAAVILHNIMSGIKSIEDEKREHPSLLMCALVINREGEDTGKFDADLQLEKIEDWRKEGYDALPFFTFALCSIQGFRETYVEHITKELGKNQTKKQVQNTF